MFSMAGIFFAVALCLIFNWPPNWRPDMDPVLVHVGVVLGGILILAATVMSIAGVCKSGKKNFEKRIWAMWITLSSPHGLSYSALSVVIVLLVTALIARPQSEQTILAAHPEPELHILMTGGDVFVVGPETTGIRLNTRIWNTGAPSVATSWSLVIFPPGPTVPVRTQFVTIDHTYRMPDGFEFGPSDSLDAATLKAPVTSVPTTGSVLFMAPLPRDIVNRSRMKLIVKDIHEHQSDTFQDMNEWMHGQ